MKMINTAKKEVTDREAVVEAKILLKSSVIKNIKNKKLPKGDCIGAARLAGILAAKKTPELIPLCHPIPIDYVDIKFNLKKTHIKIRATVKGLAKTGVEMEAFTAATIACVTIYDMCKSLDRGITISEIRLIKKTGGKGGEWKRT